jgi:hypothetical protein
MPALSHQDRLLLQQALCATPQFGTDRGRETLLQNTLGAYPHTVKALQWVNLQGSREEVAYDLVSKIEGLESSPGISALALIAAAIQPLVSSEYRDKLADLRRRLHWTETDAASLDANTWRETRTDDETLERVIGENTLRHLYYLRQALVAAESVVRIDINGAAKGTGFLVAPGIVMTCNHVIPDAQQASRAAARFFEEQSDPTITEPPRRAVIVKVEEMLYTNATLDFTLLKLGPGGPQPSPLKLTTAPVMKDDRVPIIQHPEGMAKQISIQKNLVAYADQDKVQYYTTTLPGSSGSPVFDNQFDVVAIHRKWVDQEHFPVADGATALHPYRNQGTSMIAIVVDLRKNDLLKYVTL